MEIKLSVQKRSVLNEVAKTTSYIGAAMAGEDEEAYDRICTTDENEEMLQRFWTEAADNLTERIKPFVLEVSDNATSSAYNVVLDVSTLFNEALQRSIENAMWSYFVSFLVGKWSAIVNPKDTERAVTETSALVEEIRRMLFHNHRPKRLAPIG